MSQGIDVMGLLELVLRRRLPDISVPEDPLQGDLLESSSSSYELHKLCLHKENPFTGFMYLSGTYEIERLHARRLGFYSCVIWDDVTVP